MMEKSELKAKNSFAYSLSSMSSAFARAWERACSPSMSACSWLSSRSSMRSAKKSGAVIVGRCADYVLKDIPGVTNVFIYGEHEDRVKRAVENYGVKPEDAEDVIASYDKARANYYNYHTGRKWETTGTTIFPSTAAISAR